MNLRSIIFITTLFSFISLSVESRAYQEIDVTNGGTVRGKVVLTGEMPHPRVYHLVLFPNIDMCAEIDTDDEMNRDCVATLGGRRGTGPSRDWVRGDRLAARHGASAFVAY
jgi:hypothetical protein